MIAVIFEVEPHPNHKEAYFETAASIAPLLREVEGFISVERFQSLTNPDKMLSLSFFEDESALTRWRRTHEHRTAQSAGRDGVFADYRLRVAHVLRDYGKEDRQDAPDDSRALHDG